MISFGLSLAALALTGALTGPQVGADRLPGPVSDDKLRAAADARRVVTEKMRDASRDAEEEQAAKEAARRDQEERWYEQGQDALEEARWQQAVERFTSVASAKLARADAALYWKAYALDKLGQKAEALATTAELIKGYPQSRWISDAKVLELQVRQSSGQPVPPEAQADEDLKLLALQGLQHSSPDQAVPMLEKILQGPNSPRLKERALFVLAQSNSPQARQILTNAAKGASNPDLQRRAIQYLGVHGGAENRAVLAQIYESTTDVDIKRRILRSFGVAGDKARVLAAATSETTPELRAEAVQQLGVMSAHEELWQLYQKESNLDLKKRILQAMFVGGNSTRLIDLAKTEQNPELRRIAIRNLGLMGASRTAEALTSIYASEKDLENKKAVINALFLQSNAEQLVAIARKETDPQLRRELVSRLSNIGRSKVAMDYLMEILNK